MTLNAQHDHQFGVVQPGAAVITDGLASRSDCQSLLSGSTDKITRQVINGHPAELIHENLAHPPAWWLCVPEDDGLYVMLAARHDPASLVTFFRHHLRLLGPNPAHWTTRPVAP
jgi:hypothetical protein